jgi:nicotinate-nucleotide pyrophosphorylase (carboxylating)
MIAPLPDVMLEPIVRATLAEDLGRAGDVTAAACLPADAQLAVHLVARKAGRIAGLDCARLAFTLMDPSVRLTVNGADGQDAEAGERLITIEGNARAILSAERTALNLMGRMCGVATLTARYVKLVEGTGARIVCTRKTTPGLRALEKYAVRCGGGVNHRFGLDDAILIKDNHVAACGGVAAAVRNAKAAVGHLMAIEVEVDTLAQLDEALPFAPNAIMLDNFSLEDLRTAVSRAKGKAVLEASGGVNLQTVRAIAETGVDVISVGALTHSAPVLDVALDAA